MGRGDSPGGYVLNSEELATIYHFPLGTVKAPMVMRTGAKKSEPPATLPVAGNDFASIALPNLPEPPPPPEGLPEPVLVQSSAVGPAAAAPLAVLPEQVQFIEIPDVSEGGEEEKSGSAVSEPPSNLPAA
jgi:hypothetical protein